MKISQSFNVSQPLASVWELFQDVPRVARCMPGAELTEDKGNGVYAGRLGIKLGPFSASFDGEATVSPKPDEFSGHVEGRGIDKRGGSRSKLVMDYRLEPADEGTRVTIDADLQLSGPVAQFGRAGIVNETAAILIGQFVRNVEAQFHGDGAEADAARISAGTVAWQLMKSKLFGRGQE
jgi:carbon-monoxide dehydrogenase small subunit